LSCHCHSKKNGSPQPQVRRGGSGAAALLAAFCRLLFGVRPHEAAFHGRDASPHSIKCLPLSGFALSIVLLLLPIDLRQNINFGYRQQDNEYHSLCHLDCKE
jgi:hypothetical protein